MKPAEFQRMTVEHGGVAGVSVVDPHIDVETPGKGLNIGEVVKSKGPNPTPRYRYVFNDGTEFEALTNANGDLEVTDPGTAMKPATTAIRDASAAETARHNRVTEAAAANTASRAAVRESRTLTMQERAAEAETKWRNLNGEVAKGNLSLAQRNATWKEYQDGVTNDIAKSRIALDQQQETRLGATSARQSTLAEATFGQAAGRDAMSAAEKSYDAQRASAYGAARASGKGPAEAVHQSMQTAPPDFNAIAEAAAQRAVASLRGLPPPGAVPPAGSPPVPVAARPGPTPTAVATQQLAGAQQAGAMAPPPPAPAAPLPSDVIAGGMNGPRWQ